MKSIFSFGHAAFDNQRLIVKTVVAVHGTAYYLVPIAPYSKNHGFSDQHALRPSHDALNESLASLLTPANETVNICHNALNYRSISKDNQDTLPSRFTKAARRSA